MHCNRVSLQVCYLLLLIIVLASASLIHAQTDQGRIGGVVTDANGAVVPGASLLVKNDRTGEERTATTTESGYYAISALKPSTYTVTAAAHNLTVRVTNVQLLVGQELNLGLTLQATGVEAKVDIVAAADTGIDTGSAAMGLTSTHAKLKLCHSMADNSRSFIYRRRDRSIADRARLVIFVSADAQCNRM